MDMAYDAWKKLEEQFEGTQAMKASKAYIKRSLLVSRCMMMRVC
jgi:hypothetical protein